MLKKLFALIVFMIVLQISPVVNAEFAPDPVASFGGVGDVRIFDDYETVISALSGETYNLTMIDQSDRQTRFQVPSPISIKPYLEVGQWKGKVNRVVYIYACPSAEKWKSTTDWLVGKGTKNFGYVKPFGRDNTTSWKWFNRVPGDYAYQLTIKQRIDFKEVYGSKLIIEVEHVYYE